MTSGEKPVEARDMSIKTASVQIKVLTLNSKQMTLAVFRQIKSAPLHQWWRAWVEGKAIHWGIINYCTPDCQFGKSWEKRHPSYWGWDHFHLVWQFGTELRRTAVPIPPWGSECYDVPEAEAAPVVRAIGSSITCSSLCRADRP